MLIVNPTCPIQMGTQAEKVLIVLMLSYKTGLRYPFGFRVFGFGFEDGLSSESVFDAVSGFEFGCTETPPDPNPPRCHP